MDKLTRIIRREVILGGEANTIGTDNNELLEQLLERARIDDYVSTQLQNSNRINPMIQLAMEKENELMANIPHLPVMSVYTSDEYNALRATYDNGVHPSNFVIAYRFSPVQVLSSIGSTVGFSIRDSDCSIVEKVSDISIDVTLLALTESDNTAELAFDYVMTTVDGEVDANRMIVRMGYSDGITVFILNSYALKEYTDTQTTEYDTNHSKYIHSVEEVFFKNVRFGFMISEARASLTQYTTPEVQEHLLIDVSYEQGFVSDYSKVYINEVKGQAQPVYNITVPTYRSGVVYDESQSDHRLERLWNKLRFDCRLYAVRLQRAEYGVSYELIKDELLQSSSELQSEMVTGSLMDVISKVSDLSNSVARYKDFNLTLPVDDAKLVLWEVPWVAFTYLDKTASLLMKGGSSNPKRNGPISTYGPVSNYRDIRITERLKRISDLDIGGVYFPKIHEDGDMMVYVKLEHSKTVKTQRENYMVNDAVRSGSMDASGLYTFDEGGETLTQKMVMTQGQSDITPYTHPTTNTVNIKSVTVLFKRAIGHGKLANSTLRLKVAYNRLSRDLLLSNGIATEMVTEAGRYYGQEFDVNVAMVEANLNADFKIKFNQLRQDVITTVTTQAQPSVIAYSQSMLENYESTLTLKTTRTSAPSDAGGIDVEVILTPSKRLLYRYTSSDSYTNLVAGFKIPWATFGSGFDQHYESLARQHVVFQLSGGIEVNFPVAPIDIGVRSLNDVYVTALGLMLDVLRNEIAELREEFDDLKAEFEYFRDVVTKFMESFDKSFWDTILDIFLDIALGFAGGLAGTILAQLGKAIKSAIGTLHRVSARIVAQSSNAIKLSKLNKIGGMPMVSISETAIQNEMMLSAMKVTKTDLIPTNIKRPLYQTKWQAADIDVSDKIDLVTDIRTNYAEAINDRVKVFGLNSSTLELPMPTISTYHRPLATLPTPISNILHNAFSNTQNFRNKLASDRMNVTTRNPSHAFCLYDDWSMNNGKPTITRTYMGIGELNVHGRPTGDKGAGIGGVQLKGEVSTVYNDTYLIKWKGPDEAGYTPEQVRNLYKTLYGGEADSKMSTARIWDEIIDGVEHKIHTSNMLNETVLPDIHKTNSLGNLLRDPPAWNYNLLNNNCQNFVEDIVGYLSGKGLPARWDPESQVRLQSGRIISFSNTLDSMDVRRRDLVVNVRKLQTRVMPNLKGMSLLHFKRLCYINGFAV